MTTKRLLLLLCFLIVGFSGTFLLPVAAKNQPVGIKLELPQYVGSWYGTDQKITERELAMLAPDTEFARKVYTNGRGDAIFVSIVLSGHDLDNSIHRPERCLPAQGWTIADSRQISLPVKRADGQPLEATRLFDVRTGPTKDGKVVSINNLNYYWFVGYNRLTPSHLERTIFDIRDRVLRGYNQRWAFVTVAADITQGLVRFGKSEKETDAMIQNFIRELYPNLNAPLPEQPAFANSGRSGG